MSVYRIHGGKALYGTLRNHGAKNAALPLLSASLLCERTTLENCPRLSDVAATLSILRQLGCTVREEGERVELESAEAAPVAIPRELMEAMRSSILFLGPLLGRWGKAELCLPGGCELGPRPIDLHLKALAGMGAEISERGSELICTAPKGLHGARLTLPFPSVGATENILLAASTAKGVTLLRNPAREPEIGDLCDFLNAAGAHIETLPDGALQIEGVSGLLPGARHRVLPDRIEAATYLAAVAAAGGELTLTDCRPEHLAAVLDVLARMGCELESGVSSIRLRRKAPLLGAGTIKTMPYPGFPTDAQALLMATAVLAQGTTVFVENIFSARFTQVPELARMGARITVEGRAAVVEGVRALYGAPVRIGDLRAGGCLVIAALAAQGESLLTETRHLERGYQELPEALTALGGHIIRE